MDKEISNIIEMDYTQYTEYTDLEKREISELTHRIKHSHDTHIKNIDPVTTDMIHLLHHDEHLKSIYGKKRILTASLREMYVNKQKSEKQKKEHEEEIEKREHYIDKRLYEEDMAKYPRPSACRRSWTCCRIF
jgi:hypothetical protein